MVDYQQQFSASLPVGAGNAGAALALYKERKAEVEAQGEAIGFKAESDGPDDDALWLWDGDGQANIENVIAFALRCADVLNLSGTWGFHWSQTCSRHYVGEFGGGAHLLDLGRRASLAWIDCSKWLAQRTGAGTTRRVMAETILDPVAAAEGWTPVTQVGVLLGFIDKLIDANPCVAGQLRADLAEAVAIVDEMDCGECGKPMFIANGGTSHHVGAGPDGIDHGRDRDHAAIADGDAAAPPSNSPDSPCIARARTDAPGTTRVGRWYATGPADRLFVPDDPAFAVHRVVSDDATVSGCVTVENPAGQRFPVPIDLVDDIAAPAGERWTLLDRQAGQGEPSP